MRLAPAPARGPVNLEEGKRVAALFGCTTCHSSAGSVVGKVGPSWKGLAGSTSRFSDGTQAVADAAYLRQSITDPGAKVVSGFEKSDAGMPNYGGVLTDSQLDSLLLYIQSLTQPEPAPR